MKNHAYINSQESKYFSLLSLLLVILAALALRVNYWENNTVNGYNATSWDALGYYMYQPGFLIYDDVKELKWFPEIDSTYHVSGGEFYQVRKVDNGNFVFKYLGGVSIQQLPFFYVGHKIAKFTGAPQDGFSWPYQYAIVLGAIFWFFLGLIFLRKTLLAYFSDTITAFTLLLIFLATNLAHYISIDGAMSHSWIFTLYCFQLWFTHKWHKNPTVFYALLIGLTIGIATISRPTELIMLFIPLLWNTHTKEQSRNKWEHLKRNPKYIAFVVLGAFIGILPQLLYWHYATGQFVYDVGSKWYFFTPWLRIIFGFYSGWFIYTPITILFIVGLWFMKNKPFKKAVITFTLLNIWIVTAWSDWKYGVSYAGRALVQGTPIYALALASFLSVHFKGNKRWFFIVGGIILIIINLYQITIYNSGIYNNFSVLEKIVNWF